LKKHAQEDALFMAATEAGAEDFEAADDAFMITTSPDQLIQVKEKLDQMGIPCEEAELQMIPKVVVECDPETQKLNLELIDYLEALDDVDAVYHNMKLD
jgi:transcriptional/translational regulatory protein YebC/TACO1